MKRKLSQAEKNLEIITEQIADKIEKVLTYEKERNFALERLEKMTQEVKEIRESEEILTGQLAKTEVKVRTEQIKNDKLTEVTDGIKSMHEKMKVGFQPVESTLSCLSCLEYLIEPEPLTLVCGHSICAKCFNQHSDPNS